MHGLLKTMTMPLYNPESSPFCFYTDFYGYQTCRFCLSPLAPAIWLRNPPSGLPQDPTADLTLGCTRGYWRPRRGWAIIQPGVERLLTGRQNQILIPLTFHLTTVCPNIIKRSVWEARETHCPKMNLPAKYVIIIHTAGTSCTVSTDCQTVVRNIQSFHMDTRNFCDIGYQ